MSVDPIDLGNPCLFWEIGMKFRCENCGKTFSKDIKSTAADFWFRKHPRCPHCGSYCTEKI